jgi:hypothetical protein
MTLLIVSSVLLLDGTCNYLKAVIFHHRWVLC